MTPSEALRALFAAWEAGDPAAIGDLFTDDGVYEDPLKPAVPVGPTQIREANARGVSTIRGCRITLRHMVESGAVGVCEGLFEAEVPETGGRLDFAFAAIVEMRDGRIRRLAEYFDTRPLTP